MNHACVNLTDSRDKKLRHGPFARLSGWLIGFMLTCLSGCSYVLFLGYLIGGPPSIEPSFDRETKESMTAKDVTVAVLCYAPPEVRYSFENIDTELGKYVTYRLHEHKIVVINPDRVKAWLDQNKDWDKPEELGAAFNVTYVIYIDLNQFSLYEEGSATLYRGRAEAIVSVWKMQPDGTAERIFQQEVRSRFPLHQPRPASEESYTSFKARYLSRLSEEIGRLFYEYYVADDIVDGG
ncbi:MAG: hypothetical protein KatS3mg114_0518 [Planctomycetaceae bacterium]|nr:MAG: hypothetical protein KatS3mg114_0518 [Planctomycetaceae bacterium]